MIKLHNLIAGEDIRSGWRGALRGQSLRTPVKSVPVVCISVFIYMFFGAVAVADQPVERFVLKAHAMAVSFSVEINAVYMVFIQSGKENEAFVSGAVCVRPPGEVYLHRIMVQSLTGLLAMVFRCGIEDGGHVFGAYMLTRKE